MADYIEIEPGLVISDDGEIIESAGIDDAMAFLARRRHEAHVQEKEWESYGKTIDMVLLKRQSEKKLSYGDVVISVMGGTYPKTNSTLFAEELADMPLEIEFVFDIIAAATGFRRDTDAEGRGVLPESVRALYDECTAHPEKRPWIQSSAVRKQAPTMTRVKEEALA